MKPFLFLLLCVALTGCEPRGCAPDIAAFNRAVLAGHGEVVGSLPDGRTMERYTVIGEQHRWHFVYVVNGSITVNRLEQQGKTQVNRTEVIIDGTTFVPKAL